MEPKLDFKHEDEALGCASVIVALIGLMISVFLMHCYFIYEKDRKEDQKKAKSFESHWSNSHSFNVHSNHFELKERKR